MVRFFIATTGRKTAIKRQGRTGLTNNSTLIFTAVHMDSM